MKNLYLLLLCLFACTTLSVKEKPVELLIENYSASITKETLISPQVPNKVITLKCDGTCTDSEVKELPAIEAKMNQTLSSKCFMDFILDPKRRLDNVNGWNRPTILSKLTTPTTLTLSYYSRRFTKAVGFEDAADFSVIHFNRAKLAGWSTCDKASLGGHEFSHTKNFFHNGNAAPPNFYTVPYQVNHAFGGGDGNEACCID